MSIDDPNDTRLAARDYFVQRGVDSVRHGGAGLRTFLNIAAAWGLSVEEQMDLLDINDLETFEDWTVRVRSHEATAIPVDVIVRIGCVLSIYGSLTALFPEDRAADWLRASNLHEIFGGASALTVMTRGTLDGPLSTGGDLWLKGILFFDYRRGRKPPDHAVDHDHDRSSGVEKPIRRSHFLMDLPNPVRFEKTAQA